MRHLIISFALILFANQIDAQPGSLDLTFGGIGYVTTKLSVNDKCYALAIQNDQKIVAVGCAVGDNIDFATVRYNTNGTVDSSFGTNGRIITPVLPFYVDIARAVAIQTNGKILVAGESSSGSISDFSIIRYNLNGTLDSSFGTGGEVTVDLNNTVDMVRSLALQSDGKIIVIGYAFTSTVPDIGIIRCNSDGSLDNTFGTNGRVITHLGNSSTHTQTECVVIQPDGKIIVATNPTISNCDFTLLRYNSNGSLDSTFGVNGIAYTNLANSYTYYSFNVALQIDGKIIVSGNFSGNPNYGFCVARFNPDGLLDSLFGTLGLVMTTFALPAQGYGMTFDNDGKIIIVGGSDGQSPNSGFALARYDTVGTLDSTFGSNGTICMYFGYGHNDCGRKVAIQNDNKIVVAGTDLDPDLGSNFAIARFNSVPLGAHEFVLEDRFNIYPNPTTGRMKIDCLNKEIQEISIFNIIGNLLLQVQCDKERSEIDISTLAIGMYIIKVTGADWTVQKKIIKE